LRSKSLRPSRECPKLPQGLLLGHAKAANWNLIWVEMWYGNYFNKKISLKAMA